MNTLHLTEAQLADLKRQQRRPVMPPVPESSVLAAALATLELHPKVAWAARINSGAFVVQGRFIKAAWRGCSDIIGMLKGGRFLAIECKSASGRETADQRAFGAAVTKGGGLYAVVRNVDDVLAALA